MKLKRRKKTDGPLPPRRTKPESSRRAPVAFPILDGVGDAHRTFPGELLDNEHCIALHGRGLTNMAERGGLGPEEIAGNLRRLTLEEARAMPRPEAERIIAEATVALWRGAKLS